MDVVKMIVNEITCFIKAGLDISLQKLEEVFRRNNSGL